MEVFLIRHTSVDVPPKTLYGRTDVPLKSTFEQEAAAVKSKLAGLSFDKVFTSPLTRAARLAAFCGYPGAEVEPRIVEADYGQWEMKRLEDIDKAQLQLWYDDWKNNGPAGGESFMDQYRRVSAFFEELGRKPYGRVAIFAHGGTIMCAAVYAGLIKPEEFSSAQYPYGSILKINI